MNKILRVWGVRLCLVVIALMDVNATAGESRSPLTLSQAVKQALESNPEIQRFSSRLRASEAKAKQAPYLEDPEIAIQLESIPLSHPASLNRADTNSIGIRQRLPFFGKLSLQEKIAIQDVKVAEQELRAKEREIISQAKGVYAELFMAQRTVEITREQLEIMRTIIRASEARYQVGKVMQQDVLKALLEQSAIMNQQIVAEQERKTAEVKLNVAMRHSPETAIELPLEVSTPDITQSLGNAEALALANRPELKGAEREIERSESTYSLAQRNRKFPDFMVGWDYARMPTEMTKNRYSAMVNITIPFSPWTAGKREYEVEQALEEIRAAKANQEAMKFMTLREIGELRAKVQAAGQAAVLFREGILPQAELSFRSSLAAYQAGKGEFIALLDAERALREARMGYYKNRVNLMQAIADLERVVGKELQ